jgi:hypothetical protein
MEDLFAMKWKFNSEGQLLNENGNIIDINYIAIKHR